MPNYTVSTAIIKFFIHHLIPDDATYGGEALGSTAWSPAKPLYAHYAFIPL
jgi:hypothetical protein